MVTDQSQLQIDQWPGDGSHIEEALLQGIPTILQGTDVTFLWTSDSA